MCEPIGSYALISDSQGSALVSRDGSIDWACLPRFDSPSTFARLLGADAGHWRIAPAGPAEVSRSYLDGTMVFTTFTTRTGAMALTDSMPYQPGARGHELGASSPHAIVRVVEGWPATWMELELAPRPEYGLTVPVLVAHGGGMRTRGGPHTCLIAAGVPLEKTAGTARARFRVVAGERRGFALRFCSPWGGVPDPWSEEDIVRLLDSTIASWRSWSAMHEGYQGAYREGASSATAAGSSRPSGWPPARTSPASSSTSSPRRRVRRQDAVLQMRPARPAVLRPLRAEGV